MRGGVCAVWLIWYLALFPGIYGYDGAFWLLEWDNSDVPLSSQWSVLYTFVYHALFSLGAMLFGSNEGGFALFSAVQMIFVLVIIVTVLKHLSRYAPRWSVVLATVLYCAIPVLPILSVSSAQDALFMALFTLLVLSACEIARKGLRKCSIKDVIAFVVVAIALCLVRNNGLYALFIAFFFAMAVSHGSGRHVLASAFAVVAAVVLVLQGPVYNILGVQSGTSIREAVSVPTMQVERVFYYWGSDIDQATWDTAKKYIDLGNNNSYPERSELADQFKANLMSANIAADKMGALSFYVQLGFDYPKDYLEGAALLSLGLWYPDKQYPDSRMWHPYLESECYDATLWSAQYATVRSESVLPLLDDFANSFYGGSQDGTHRGQELFSTVPIWSQLQKHGVYLLALCFFTACTLRQRRYRNMLFPIGLFWGLEVTLFLAPAVLARYVAPIMMAMPVVLAWFAAVPPVKRRMKVPTDTVFSDNFQRKGNMHAIRGRSRNRKQPNS